MYLILSRIPYAHMSFPEHRYEFPLIGAQRERGGAEYKFHGSQ